MSEIWDQYPGCHTENTKYQPPPKPPMKRATKLRFSIVIAFGLICLGIAFSSTMLGNPEPETPEPTATPGPAPTMTPVPTWTPDPAHDYTLWEFTIHLKREYSNPVVVHASNYSTDDFEYEFYTDLPIHAYHDIVVTFERSEVLYVAKGRQAMTSQGKWIEDQ